MIQFFAEHSTVIWSVVGFLGMIAAFEGLALIADLSRKEEDSPERSQTPRPKR